MYSPKRRRKDVILEQGGNWREKLRTFVLDKATFVEAKMLWFAPSNTEECEGHRIEGHNSLISLRDLKDVNNDIQRFVFGQSKRRCEDWVLRLVAVLFDDRFKVPTRYAN